MKKRILMIGLSVILCLLGGCLEDTPLTEAEMDVVAEYAAGLLLKYDKNYSTPLYYSGSLAEMERLLTPTPIPTPTPVITGTPVTGTNNTSGTNSEQSKITPVPLSPDNPETSRQLTEILAVENITVSCEGFELMESVVSNEYFTLAAKEGRQYAVVYFELQNNTAEELIFDASKRNLEYSIDINTGTVSRVSLSMLEQDLQYMPITVPANATAEAVLVFEIDAVEINTAHLIIEDDTDNVVFIKMQ